MTLLPYIITANYKNGKNPWAFFVVNNGNNPDYDQIQQL
jgi:hypothetical protein